MTEDEVWRRVHEWGGGATEPVRVARIAVYRVSLTTRVEVPIEGGRLRRVARSEEVEADGAVVCPRCLGTRGETCTMCGGHGRCPDCDRRRLAAIFVVCLTCSNTRRCQACGGKPWIPCPLCGGAGAMVRDETETEVRRFVAVRHVPELFVAASLRWSEAPVVVDERGVRLAPRRAAAAAPGAGAVYRGMEARVSAEVDEAIDELMDEAARAEAERGRRIEQLLVVHRVEAWRVEAEGAAAAARAGRMVLVVEDARGFVHVERRA